LTPEHGYFYIFQGGNVDKTDFGGRMKERRLKMGMSQIELARTLAVTPQHISAIEQGKRSPSLSFVLALAAQLGVTTDFLLAGKEQSRPDTITVIRADQRLPLEIREALITIIKATRKKN
jgi:transcriptional regulator with XRE-family HTH domain